MNDFAAIDFETANNERTSACSVGIVIVRNGEIVDRIYRLIRPEPNYYSWFCQKVHGLGDDDTCNAPVFSVVWSEIAPLIEGLPLIAHNATFDISCLKALHRVYQIDYPDYEIYCTMQASRRVHKGILPNHKLNTVSAYCGFDLTNHHHALADAEACAIIALQIL